MTDLTSPTLRTCGRYRPGHDVHWIQALLGRQDPARWTGRVSDVGGGVVSVVHGSTGAVHRYRHHDPVRFVAALRRHGSYVTLSDRSSLMTVGPRGHGWDAAAFSVAPDEGVPLEPCAIPLQDVAPWFTVQPPAPEREAWTGDLLLLPSPSADGVGVRRGRCRRHEAGHELHWVQALRATRSTTGWWGHVGGILDGVVHVLDDRTHELRRYRHHAPERLADTLRRDSTGVVVDDRLGVLQVRGGRRRGAVFSVLPDDGRPLTPCGSDGDAPRMTT